MAFSLEFFKIVDNRRIHFFYAVHDDTNRQRIWIDSIHDQPSYIIFDSLDTVLEHGFILAVHAYTDGQFESFWVLIIFLWSIFEKGNEVISVILPSFF